MIDSEFVTLALKKRRQSIISILPTTFSFSFTYLTVPDKYSSFYAGKFFCISLSMTFFQLSAAPRLCPFV